mmetsp:Transcript_63083/g.195774  ORF Transcript_63083/g.195774 Transcript_63083/m.195774 type:complete len:405 (+) Transcript_63083:180-1394(+)
MLVTSLAFTVRRCRIFSPCSGPTSMSMSMAVGSSLSLHWLSFFWNSMMGPGLPPLPGISSQQPQPQPPAAPPNLPPAEPLPQPQPSSQAPLPQPPLPQGPPAQLSLPQESLPQPPLPQEPLPQPDLSQELWVPQQPRPQQAPEPSQPDLPQPPEGPPAPLPQTPPPLPQWSPPPPPHTEPKEEPPSRPLPPLKPPCLPPDITSPMARVTYAEGFRTVSPLTARSLRMAKAVSGPISRSELWARSSSAGPKRSRRASTSWEQPPPPPPKPELPRRPRGVCMPDIALATAFTMYADGLRTSPTFVCSSCSMALPTSGPASSRAAKARSSSCPRQLSNRSSLSRQWTPGVRSSLGASACSAACARSSRRFVTVLITKAEGLRMCSPFSSSSSRTSCESPCSALRSVA